MFRAQEHECRARTSWGPRTRAGAVLFGMSMALTIASGALIVDLYRGHWSLREVPLMNYLVLFPAVGAIFGYARWKKRWRAANTGELTAGAGPDSEPQRSPGAEEFRRARLRRDVARGFWGGCALALIATAADLAWRGWYVLASHAALNLMLFPFLCAELAFLVGRVPGERWPLGRVRLKISTLMALIAYLAVFLGVVVEGQRIGGPAFRYHSQQINSHEMGARFRDFTRKFAR